MAKKITIGTDYKTKSGYKTSSKTTYWKKGRLITEKYATRRENFGGDDYRNFTILQSTSSINVFGIVFVVLLFATIIGMLSSGRTFTFMGFLEFLSTVPNVDITVLTNGLSNSLAGISADWIRQLLTPFVSAINIIMFLFGGIAQALVVIVWFAGYLFGF